MVGSDHDLQAEIVRQIREDASGQTSFIAVVIRDGVVCDKRFSVRATLADRSGVTSGNSFIDLPGEEIVPSAAARRINLGGACYLVLQVTQANGAPDSGKHAAAPSAALLVAEVPTALPTLLQANSAPDAGIDEAAAAPVALSPGGVPEAAQGVVEAFARHDKDGTGDLPRQRLVAICSKLDARLDGDTIEALIDSSGLVRGGRINYNDFLAWLFADGVACEELPGRVRPSNV